MVHVRRSLFGWGVVVGTVTVVHGRSLGRLQHLADFRLSPCPEQTPRGLRVDPRQTAVEGRFLSLFGNIDGRRYVV